VAGTRTPKISTGVHMPGLCLRYTKCSDCVDTHPSPEHFPNWKSPLSGWCYLFTVSNSSVFFNCRNGTGFPNFTVTFSRKNKHPVTLNFDLWSWPSWLRQGQDEPPNQMSTSKTTSFQS